VTIDHFGEALVGFEPAPFQARAPVVEETARPALALVVPQLAEGLLQDVGGVEALVGCQQQFERTPALQGEVLSTRQQRVLLALDEARSLPPTRAYSALRTLFEGIPEMAQDVELVEQDRRSRRLSIATFRNGFHMSITTSLSAQLPLGEATVFPSSQATASSEFANFGASLRTKMMLHSS